ncbi:TIGR02680 family protein [Frankia sp. EI5c]|uniref:TIGR02680 family protein n=1 Tax=Frankia sp. EI5c TaxID=683316 RepID=UPI0007C35F6B|nr:TIGR02680 family protein [Frankia sp. EI5c]OAA27487.1 TIGR02680 family protein [Frankia sp. EI5c]
MTASEFRWRPHRAGIVNVWRYYDETFGFHRGRLLLRGRNGTGKSKALELLLPYLLDANLQARRLSTFGGSERTMHWNLMGDGASGRTRVGYVWIEFHLGDAADPGGGRWFTCGARLQASQHTTTVSADYFTTTRRIGLPGGLSVVDEANAPLTRKRLAADLGDTGQLYDSAADYRAAVRAALFGGLNEQRYSGLITAMLQLRTPKLSERLDPSLLSTLLSRALPPLGTAEIAELAEGFERLDRQRENVRRLDEEVEAARILADRQRAYAGRVLRAAAGGLISATSAMDDITRTARESQAEYERVVAERDSLDERVTAAEGEGERHAARIEGLMLSEAYRAGGQLDELRRDAREAAGRADDARRQARQARSRADTDQRTAATTQAAAARAETESAAARDHACGAADRAGLAVTYDSVAALVADHAAGVAQAGMAQAGAAQAGAAQPRTLVRAAVDARVRQIRAVRRALGDREAAVIARTGAEQRLEHAREALAAATADRDTAAAAYTGELTALGEALARWAAGCAELRFDDPTVLLAAVESEPDLLRIIEEATGPLLEAIAARTAELTRDQAERTAERAAHIAERNQREAAAELPPVAPPTRTADREGRPGAPLWRLVAFRDGVEPAIQAGVEAALEASGLLDAWVFPTGRLELTGHDTTLDVELLAPTGDGGLGTILEPEPDAAVPADRVRRLLAGIALAPSAPSTPSAPSAHSTPSTPGGHPVVVGADGTWRLAALRGSWSKPEPAHIGALARDRARRRRIAELTALISALDDLLAGLEREVAELRARRERIAADRRTRPGYQAVQDARAALDTAEANLGARADLVSRSVEQVREAAAAVSVATRALTAAGAEHGLPTEPDALDTVEESVDIFRRLADDWFDRHQHAVATRAAALAAAEVAAISGEAARTLAESSAERDSEAQRVTAKLAGVEAAIGPGYRQVLDEITGLRGRMAELARERAELRQALRALDARVGELNTRRVVDQELRQQAVAARDSQAERFRQLGLSTLAADARLDLALSPADGVRATLDRARAVATALASVPHTVRTIKDAETRLTDAVHQCRQVLADRAELVVDPDEDVQILTAAVDGIRVGVAHLHDSVRDERDRARTEITDGERDLFDRTLTGNTRRHLADRIRQANALVADMNSRLEKVRTASRIAVQILWRVDPELPAATRQARDLLLRDPTQLTAADREALHTFLRGRLDDARDHDDATGWEELLLQVFDYTAWHQFIVRIDRGTEQGWQPLTKKLHGALSGGEKAIALHLPLFAALAAHYQSAPAAPRLILLDEVFVGVDSTNRGQVFELLTSLDLDLMITSDHEWCTYRELDGIAIHTLITGDGTDDAVTTARFTWDGQRLTDAAGQPL